MGTRADFYIRDEEKLQWLGSIGWDGYPEGIDRKLLRTTEVEEFKTNITNFFLNREDFTSYKDGWPWPWFDSNTTDYSYVYDVQLKQVLISTFGSPYFTWEDQKKYDRVCKRWNKKYEQDPDNVPDYPDFGQWLVKTGHNDLPVFPNMKDIQNVKLDGPASGLIVIRRKPSEAN